MGGIGGSIRRRSPAHIVLGALFVAVMIGFVLVATLTHYGSLPPASFYSSAAQIIPVLIVALAVESRARDVWDAVHPVTKASLIGSLVLGETMAIVASSGVVAVPLNDYERYVAGPGSNSGYQDAGILVGPGIAWSEVMAAITAAALAVGFLGVVVVALVRRGTSHR